MKIRDRHTAVWELVPCLVAVGMLALAGAGFPGDDGGGGQAGPKTAAGQEAPVSKVRVGVFESRAIAVAFAASKHNTFVRDLKVEHDKAVAAGDQEKMEELEEKARRRQDRMHHQGFGLALVDDLLEPIKDSFPEICREAGVDVIAQYVVHSDPPVELVDVTAHLVKRFDPSKQTLKTIAELRKHAPLPHDKFPIHD